MQGSNLPSYHGSQVTCLEAEGGYGGDLPFWTGSSHRLKCFRMLRIVSASVMNQADYLHFGGMVTRWHIPPWIRVDVIDNASGIEERYFENIFKCFYRVKNEKTRFITGTSLGLPIVKCLLDELGGRITVQSIPDFESTFTVLLPVC